MSRPGGGHCSSLLRHGSMLCLPLFGSWRGTRVPEVPQMLSCWSCCVPGGASRAERPLVLGPLCPSRPLHTEHPFHHPIIGLAPLQTHRNATATNSGVYIIVGKVLMVQLGLVSGVGPRGRHPAPGTTLPTGANGRRHPAGTLTDASPRSLARSASASTSSASTSSRITR